MRRFLTPALRAFTLLALIGGASSAALTQDFGPAGLPINHIENLKAPAGWQRFQIGKPALITVAFPSAPRGFSPPDQSSSEQSIFVAANETTVFSVSIAFRSEHRTTSEHDRWKHFNNSAAGFLDGMRRRGLVDPNEPHPVSRDKRIKSAAGIEGFQRDVTFRQRHCRIQVFSIGSALLMLGTISTGQPQNRELDTFFNSLTLEMSRGSREEAAAVSPLADWKRLDLGNGMASATLPSEPQLSKRTLGPGSEAFYYTSRTDDALYLISYTDPPDKDFLDLTPAELKILNPMLWKAIEELLTQRFADEMKRMKVPGASDLRLRASPVQPASVGGLRGEERVFENDDLQVRAQFAVVDGRIYAVAVFATIETPFAVRDAFMKAIDFKTTKKLKD